MAKGLVDVLLDSIFDDDWKGRRGEKLTERELNLVKLFGRKGKTLRNVYIPKDNGETSELDVLYITQKGIFVFESKNYSGWIFGDEKSQYWTAMLPNKEKNRFYNPIRQNKTHLKWLQKYVGDDIPLFSIIVFSERCELKKVTVDSPDIKVIKRDRTYATVRNIWDASEDAVDDKKLEEIYEDLKRLTNVDEAVKAAHVDRIREKYQKEPAKESDQNKQLDIEQNDKIEYSEQQQMPQDLLCPKCGKTLILRTAKKGANAGKQFYGCSGFPACRYIRNLDEDDIPHA